jgi:hypothetical protein
MPTPIKRTSSLISYSKEHHFGLLLVWKIRQGIKREIITERIANYIPVSYTHLRAHET